MGTYTADRVPIPVGLDEAGLRLGLQRIPGEVLSDYRRRLLAEARDPADPSQASFIRGVGRKVGELDRPVFDIDLVLDSDGVPLAEDPHVEITSTHVRAYHNHGESQLDVEVFLEDRENGYWLVQVYNAFASSSYFSVTTLDEYGAYMRSRNLRFGNSLRYRQQQPLFPSYQNKLPDKHLKEIHFSALSAFNNKVNSIDLVVADGDYYVDEVEGQVFTFTTGDGTCSYSYAEFPYRVYWQSVRAVPLSDSDLDYRFKDELVSDSTGTAERVSLNPEGARVYNQVLLAHPLGWGE